MFKCHWLIFSVGERFMSNFVGTSFFLNWSDFLGKILLVCCLVGHHYNER